jgi:hypothetical protein
MRKTQSELESRVIVGAHGVSAEEDHVLSWKVVQVGLVSLAIFIVGGIWAWRIQVATTRELAPEGHSPIPAILGNNERREISYEIGIVNQRLFEQDTHAVEKLSAQQNALQKGLSEEKGTVAHLPISVAMEQVVAQSKAPPPAPAPAPEAPPAPQQP